MDIYAIKYWDKRIKLKIRKMFQLFERILKNMFLETNANFLQRKTHQYR